MFTRTIFATAAIAALALTSGCSHSQWRQFHGCAGGSCEPCHNGLRTAHCSGPCCQGGGPRFVSDAGKFYESCDGCGDDCGMHVEPGCGMHAGRRGCGRKGIGCWQPGALLREIFTCDGCTGPIYWSEWYNDPPECCDPCDHYGNYTGHQYSNSIAGKMRSPMLREESQPIGGDPYYDEAAPRQGSPTPAPEKSRESRMKSRVVPTSYVTPLNSKCNCEH